MDYPKTALMWNTNLISRFEHSVELDPAAADLFELELEKALVARIAWARELFAGRAELRWELEELDAELAELERRLGLNERWELCARIRDLRTRHLPNPSSGRGLCQK